MDWSSFFLGAGAMFTGSVIFFGWWLERTNPFRSWGR